MLKYNERCVSMKIDVLGHPEEYPELHRILMAQNELKDKEPLVLSSKPLEQIKTIEEEFGIEFID